MTNEKYEFRLIIQGPDGETREFPIPLGVTIIGRGVGIGLTLNDSRISRRHAQLECNGIECSLTDLESANGTRLNGEKLLPGLSRVLPEQAEIRMGGFKLFFQRIALEIIASEESGEPPQIPVGELAEEVSPVEFGADSSPPMQPPESPSNSSEGLLPRPEFFPPGLTLHSQRFLEFLPDIYHTDFISRFLAIFESILIPIEWNIGNFDLFLTPGTAPHSFLLWLSRWFDIKVDTGWNESQQRAMLSEAHQLYARRGTPGALKRVLQIYLGQEPEIVDQSRDLEPFTFKVILPVRAHEVNREAVERIIDEFKPAYTTFSLEFKS